MAFSKLKTRLAALYLLLIVVVAAVGLIAAQRLQAISASLDTVYKDRVVCQQQLRIVDEAYGVRVTGAVTQVRDGTMTPAAAVRAIDVSESAAAQQWNDYRKTYLTPREAQLAADAQPLILKAHATAEQARHLLSVGDVAGLNDFAARDMRVPFAALSTAMEGLLGLQLDVSRHEDERSQAAYRSAILAMAGLVAAALVLGGLLTWAAVLRYTEEVRAHDGRLKRMDDLYLALSQTNQLIVRESDATRLLNELCRICVDHGSARLACVSLIDGERASRFALSGPAAEFFGTSPVDWNPYDEIGVRAVTSIALREGVHAISNDYAHEAPSAAWRVRAVDFGIGSVGAFPLRRGGRLTGALALYAAEVNFFDERLVRLLDEMVGDVSFALDNIDRERASVEAQRQTISSLERFRMVFQGAPVASAILAMDTGEVLEVNNVFCDRNGITREEIIGRTMGDLGIGLPPDEESAYRERVRREGHVRNMELQTKLRSGVAATILTNAELLQYQDRTCVLVMALDVTELRRADAARQALQASEAANQAKTAFLSRMSHELRTPLNAMLGFTQLMQRDARERLSPQDLAQLDRIRQAGWHLLSLINDVLDVSRIESGTFEVRTRALALAPVLEEALHISEPLAQQSGVELGDEYRNVPSVGVIADPVRLKQVLINLMSNAIKYNRPGGSVQVHVGVDGTRAVVEVRDTGLGMTAEQLEHLYEPFNRLGRERGGIEGTGLGLALTRQLVRQMDGELEIESRIGKGTSARVRLPYVDAASIQITPERSSPIEFDCATLPSGVVLYIEDNEVNIMIVEQMLARWPSVHFVSALDGKSGVEQARLLPPDLLLLDMQLPDMDGIQVLRELAAVDVTRDLRVVALSASAMPEEVELARNSGAIDFWTKPLELDRFLGGVARILAQRSTAGLRGQAQAG